jgi:hypothetical protein
VGEREREREERKVRKRNSYHFIFLYNISCSCFIGQVEVLAGALLAPVLAVIAFNIVIFVTVMSVLIKHSKKKIQRAKASADGNSREATIRLLISIFSIMNMYGLTWLFAVFTFTDGSFAFQLLFAIFNSLQGFFMFIFFCVLGKEARDSWAHILCRGKLKKFAPNVSSSRPGAPKSSTTPNNARRYSAQTTDTLVRSAGISSQDRRSSYSDTLRRGSLDTLRRESVSSYRAEISEEPSSVSISEDYSSTGADLIEFNDGAIAADTLGRSRPSLAVTPMLTLHEEEEEENELAHSPGAIGDAENQGNAFTMVNQGAASYYGETTLIGDALELPSMGGDSASVSGASLAESGIMIDDEVSDSGNGYTPSPSRELQHNMARSRESPPTTNDGGEEEEETVDNSEVVMNPHAHY